MAARFTDPAGDAVAARSGLVVEVRGDEVFAVFGSSTHAVRAALELQATLAEESAASNPVGGWYGLKKGLRRRFGMYMPPLMEALGKAEVEHNPRNNRMRAI